MSFESKPTCQDLQRNFDSFFDGELDAHWMRSLALHLTHCATCEADARSAESLQKLLTSAVESEVDDVDADSLWRSIEARLERHAPSLARRVREVWWARWRQRLDALRVPALALSAAAAALLALAFWSSGPDLTQVAGNNHARIDRIESSAAQVMVWTEPEQHTTAIWLANYEQ